jgi:hypothetical protein
MTSRLTAEELEELRQGAQRDLELMRVWLASNPRPDTPAPAAPPQTKPAQP